MNGHPIMLLKAGVKLANLQPQMVLASFIVYLILAKSGVDTVLTSGSDSHSGGLHPGGNAIDYRTKTYKFNKRALRQEVKAALGTDFDVVLEDEGGANEHLHVEYQPK